MQVSSKQLLKPKSITINPLAADNNNLKLLWNLLSVALVILWVIHCVESYYHQWLEPQ